MELRELDQFLEDKSIDGDSKILVNQQWLQKKLLRLQELEKDYTKVDAEKRQLIEANSHLRNSLMLSESKQPYTILNVEA